MHIVTEVPFEGPRQTRLWLSDQAAKEIARFRKKGDPNGAYWKQIQRFCINGFKLYEGKKSPIRPEGDGVYRIGTLASLFRILGFYENDRPDSFIAIDAMLKHDTKLNSAERARIKEVARVKKLGLWKKRHNGDNGNYPRLAE